MSYENFADHYDLFCSSIDYQEQGEHLRRLYQLFGNGGNQHLDLACGTGTLIRSMMPDSSLQSSGVDLSENMINIARALSPDTTFHCADMSSFQCNQKFDLITCLLYSMHYCSEWQQFTQTVENVYELLNPGGVFCFDVVDKDWIDNEKVAFSEYELKGRMFSCQSGWTVNSDNDYLNLNLKITEKENRLSVILEEHHQMLASNIGNIISYLTGLGFEVHSLEHGYSNILPWKESGNAILTCVKA